MNCGQRFAGLRSMQLWLWLGLGIAVGLNTNFHGYLYKYGKLHWTFNVFYCQSVQGYS